MDTVSTARTCSDGNGILGGMYMKLGERCKHGLYCACFICGYEKEITRLKAENELLKMGSIKSNL